ncbi:MAG TPA: hypothetical protein DEA55_10290 [Rhodospirillaceae bacterium]|nr:hypothetical protein [Rhodospirillaceae bacterium]
MNIKRKNMKRINESGNVLFLILIAVALFAALSYAVTSSSRSGGGDAASESNLINSAQVTQYPASVRTAIVRMIINGTDVTQLEFNVPSAFGTLSSNSVGVFHPSGGGATFVTSSPDVMATPTQQPWLFNSRYQITNIGTTVANNTGNELIAFLPGISTSICARLNTEIGISGGTDADTNGIPSAGVAVANIPTAAMNQTDSNSGIGAYNAAFEIGGAFSGQPFGCADFDDATPGTASGDLVYFHVLVER